MAKLFRVTLLIFISLFFVNIVSANTPATSDTPATSNTPVEEMSISDFYNDETLSKRVLSLDGNTAEEDLSRKFLQMLYGNEYDQSPYSSHKQGCSLM